MKVITQRGAVATACYMKLFNACKHSVRPTAGFSEFHKKIISEKVLYLKRHFNLMPFFLLSNDQVVAAAIYFESQNGKMPNTLGGILGLPDLPATAIHQFIDEIRARVNKPFLFPVNGHLNLGFGALDPAYAKTSIGILTSGHYPVLDHLFNYPHAKTHRNFYALVTQLTKENVDQLKAELEQMPKGFTTRKLSLLNYRRDLKIYNDLINRTMNSHYHFHPMTEEENWELLGQALPIMSPALFQFLCYNGKEIGYCFAMRDYNQVLGNKSDLVNYYKMFFNRHKINRGRILSSGIIQEFRGQKLFKYLRNSVLIEFFNKGMTEIESSYIDEKNDNSNANVKSKGGQHSHAYVVFSTE